MANIMKEVAALLGVELGERFKTRLKGYVYGSEYVLHEDGIFFILDDEEKYAHGFLDAILTGKNEIIKLPWRPKKNERYYYWVNVDGECADGKWEVNSVLWVGDSYDAGHVAMGNCFSTAEEAEAHKDEVIKLYTDVLEGTTHET